MSRIRFYFDENMPNSVVRALRARGVDVLTTSEAGNLGATDEEQLRFAVGEGRVMVTQDADFLVLAGDVEHSGIVYCKMRSRGVKEMIGGLMLIWSVLGPEDMRGHVEFL